jgi:tetratricopeptide (TPR) repeat protein
MLFDLRSRGRRRAVRVIYFGLALLMLFGLVLFGVGAGNGFGGLLNAFTNGSSNGQTGAVSQQLKAAEKAAREHPTSASTVANLLQAQWIAANQGSNYNSTTGAFTSSGKQLLTQATQSWKKYQSLTSNPQLGVAIIAAKAYEAIGSYAGAAGAWEDVTLGEPSAKAYFCFAATSYAAGDKRKGDLAASRAIKLAPELDRLTIKDELKSSRGSKQDAQSVVASSC